jgi:hypothetical protein
MTEFILFFIKTLMIEYSDVLIWSYRYNLDRLENLLARGTHPVV